jgi:hypothetical protein
LIPASQESLLPRPPNACEGRRYRCSIASAGDVVEDDSAENTPAVQISSPSLVPGRLTGDSISGTGDLGLRGDWSLGASGSLPAETYPWLIANLALGDDAADTLTVPEGPHPDRRAGHGGQGRRYRRRPIAGARACSARSRWKANPPRRGHSAAEPLTFTSIDDDSVGGDTNPGANADGSAQEGDWGGILATGDASAEARGRKRWLGRHRSEPRFGPSVGLARGPVSLVRCRTDFSYRLLGIDRLLIGTKECAPTNPVKARGAAGAP